MPKVGRGGAIQANGCACTSGPSLRTEGVPCRVAGGRYSAGMRVVEWKGTAVTPRFAHWNTAFAALLMPASQCGVDVDGMKKFLSLCCCAWSFGHCTTEAKYEDAFRCTLMTASGLVSTVDQMITSLPSKTCTLLAYKVREVN
mmetsp:Transcript_2873/g.5161  ORF Transcript_2873/g.5161 Transcript_2873/m.5161 type:complete len:143 (-) Transcript_2873:403-831(-)